MLALLVCLQWPKQSQCWCFNLYLSLSHSLSHSQHLLITMLMEPGEESQASDVTTTVTLVRKICNQHSQHWPAFTFTERKSRTYHWLTPPWTALDFSAAPFRPLSNWFAISSLFLAASAFSLLPDVSCVGSKCGSHVSLHETRKVGTKNSLPINMLKLLLISFLSDIPAHS